MAANKAQLILSVGEDRPLLQSRNMILARAGYAVSAATSAAGAVAAVREMEFELVIICHSLRNKAALLRHIGNTPGLQSLVVERSDASSTATAHVNGLDGPEQLLKAIESLFQKKETGTIAGWRPMAQAETDIIRK